MTIYTNMGLTEVLSLLDSGAALTILVLVIYYGRKFYEERLIALNALNDQKLQIVQDQTAARIAELKKSHESQLSFMQHELDEGEKFNKRVVEDFIALITKVEGNLPDKAATQYQLQRILDKLNANQSDNG